MTSRSLRRRRAAHGSALAWIVGVIGVVGVLTVAIGANVRPQMGCGCGGPGYGTKDQMREIVMAIDVYRIENRRLPESLDDLVGYEYAPLMSDEVPTDSWGNEFFYEPQGSRTYELISWGADGVEGGEDEEADIDLNTMRRKDTDKE